MNKIKKLPDKELVNLAIELEIPPSKYWKAGQRVDREFLVPEIISRIKQSKPKIEWPKLSFIFIVIGLILAWITFVYF